MRDIKFRGLSVEPLAKGDDWLVDTDIYINYYDKLAYLGAQEVKFETVGQYTGLKDKNGMEIYENDVCRDGEALYVVRYSDELGQWLLHLLENGTIMNNVRYLNSDVVTEMEINGNIYENPSLLEQS